MIWRVCTKKSGVSNVFLAFKTAECKNAKQSVVTIESDTVTSSINYCDSEKLTKDELIEAATGQWLSTVAPYKYSGQDKAIITTGCLDNDNEMLKKLQKDTFLLSTAKGIAEIDCSFLDDSGNSETNKAAVYLVCQFKWSAVLKNSDVTKRVFFDDAFYKKFCKTYTIESCSDSGVSCDENSENSEGSKSSESEESSSSGTDCL